MSLSMPGMPRLRRVLGVALLAVAGIAAADSKTRVTPVDRTTVRRPSPAVTTTTTTRETRTQTTFDNGQWTRSVSGIQTKRRDSDWTGTWGETGWNGKSGVSSETTRRVEVKTGNSPARALGRTSLEKGETTWSGRAGPVAERKIRGDLGNVTLRAEAGVQGKARWGNNGVDAQGQLGAEASLKAATTKATVGNARLGASFKGTAKLEVAAIAKGKMGAYVDEKGITFGAQGSAGLYAKGELKLNFEAHVFGVKTNVNLIASGYAGAMAEGKAMATLGWNGKVSFMACLGASLGLGGGLAVEFEMDAESLMERLHLSDLQQLLDWMKGFQEHPETYLARLGIQALRKVHEAGFGVLRKLGQDAAAVFQKEVVGPMQAGARAVRDGVQRGVAFLGRLIRSPRGEPDSKALAACLDQALTVGGAIGSGRSGMPDPAFPVCQAGVGMGFGGMPDWAGMDLYGWFSFDWPAPYEWPSL